MNESGKNFRKWKLKSEMKVTRAENSMELNRKHDCTVRIVVKSYG